MSDVNNVEVLNITASEGSINETNASEATDSIRVVKFGTIKFDQSRNPRKARRYSPKELEPLARSLYKHGQQEPFVASERPDGSLHGLKGHRRDEAIKLIRNVGVPKSTLGPEIPADPTWSPKVKVRVLKGLDLQGEMDILMDHGDVVGLDKQEQLLVAKINTRYGFSHEFIAGKLGISRSNFSNGLARVVALPDCVEAAYMDESDDARAVTQAALKPIYEAYTTDLKHGGRVKEAGPRFTTAWEKFLADGAAPKIKAMSRTDILALASVTTDPDLRNLFQAIADGNKQDAGTQSERVAHRLPSFDTIGTGVVTIEEGIPSTVGDFEKVIV